MSSEGAFAQRIASVLTIPYNDTSVKHALSVLESSNLADITDKTLLSKVEASILAQVGSILNEFEPMYKALLDLGEDINAFKGDLSKINATVDTVNAAFGPMLAETKLLEKESLYVNSKLTTAQAFVENFVVTDEEAQVLTSGGDIVDNDRFYQVLDKVKSIEANCSALLAESPSLGEQLLTHMTKLLASAYEKLKLRVERTLRETNANYQTIKRDLQLLSQEPFTFKNVLGQIVDARKQAVKRDFIQQTKPLSDDEPERAVGVECAWIHSVMINEYDLFRGLLGPQNNSEDFAFTLFSADNSEDLIYELIDSIFTAVEPLFKQRLNKLISTQKRVIALDSIYNVVEFYRNVFSSHKQPTLAGCFETISNSLTSQFNHLLLVEIDAAKRTKKVSADLSSPEFVFSILGLTRKLFQNYESSMNYQPLGDAYIRGRINDLLDPIITLCYKLSETLDPYRKNIFLINCLDPIKLELTGHIFANFKIDEIDARISSHLENLVLLEYEALLKESGLELPDLEKRTAKIDEWVMDAGMSTSRRLRDVQSPSMATSVARGAHEKFLERYQEAGDLGRSAEEIKVLLG